MQRFEQIYEEHAQAVRAYVRRRAPESIVEDVVADVFVVACGGSTTSRATRCRGSTASRGRRSRTSGASGTRCRSDTSSSHEPEPVGDPQLAAAFAALSDADREILRLVAWEGLSLRDAARVLECSPVAARVRYHRAKSRLAAHGSTAAASFRPEPKGATR